MYIKLNDAQPEVYSIKQLRQDNPKTSFPKDFPDAVLAEYGVYPVVILGRPATETWQRAVRDDLPTLINGDWTLGWTLEDIVATPDQVRVEAERRISAGFSVTRGGVTFNFGSDRWEREELHLLAQEAARYVQEGGKFTDANWLDGETVSLQTLNMGDLTVNPRQMAGIGKKLMLHVRAHRMAAKNLSAQELIPANYIDDAHWP
jgi:hypothetical protein